ncbi:hypothetical protein ILUMI_22452 [Ignelater luminosus]|uniref:Metalloendopeptidase n=1 Tax=Ignelater luminosus TaxID=2038154 RepID=A0A8K0G2T6_IGNLU|nr:hypothetical protein ILUMI_22452 [Ignelater luminosus]
MFKFMVYFIAISILLIHCLPFENNTEDYDRGGADLSYLGRSVFGEPNEESGNRVEQWNKSSKVNPEELGTYAEGDILFPNDVRRSGVISETKRWPGGVVPFEINGTYSEEQREMIKKAMMEFHKQTCIRFRKRKPGDSDWIWITNAKTGCYTSIGRLGGLQTVNLQAPACLLHGTVMHELLHAIGFGHEQSRSDRDLYVTINWANIKQGHLQNFEKAGKLLSTSFGVSYDYGSIMHYSSHAFSVNGHPTIAAIRDTNLQLGQEEGFSKNDVEKIRRIYNCSNISTKQNSSEIDIDIK